MANHLDETLDAIGRDFKHQIAVTSRFFLEVDIGRRASQLGFTDIEQKYQSVQAVVPLKQALGGMKVRIDGRTFINYGQLESGVVIPGHVARESRLPIKHYTPQDSMILNFV